MGGRRGKTRAANRQSQPANRCIMKAMRIKKPAGVVAAAMLFGLTGLSWLTFEMIRQHGAYAATFTPPTSQLQNVAGVRYVINSEGMLFFLGGVGQMIAAFAVLSMKSGVRWACSGFALILLLWCLVWAADVEAHAFYVPSWGAYSPGFFVISYLLLFDRETVAAFRKPGAPPAPPAD